MSRRARRAAADELAKGLEIEDSTVAGRHGLIPVRRYRAPGATSSQALVWLHGGGFSYGGLDQLESHAAAAAIAHAGAEVVAVEYRLVPQWSWLRDPDPALMEGIRFPIPVDDAVDAFVAVADSSPRPVSLGGASAGACLAAAAAAHLVSQTSISPASLTLAYGTFHAALPTVTADISSRIRGRGRLTQFRPETVHRMNLNYAGSVEAMSDSYAFPGGHALTPLPRSLLVDADRDSLRASGRAFAEELRMAGTAVTYAVIDDAKHGFLDHPGTPEFAAGVDAITAFLMG